MVSAGDTAIDFTLPDIDGNLVTLSTLLSEKPVVLIWGMHTCPAFQGLGNGGDPPFDQCSYSHETTIVDNWHEKVTFVHLVGPEPHPTVPDVNFDAGKILLNYWSTLDQPETFSARLSAAKKIKSKVSSNALFLVDFLEGAPYEGYESGFNNPVWCTYANGARSVILVGMDGEIKYTRGWFRAENLVDALHDYLDELKGELEGDDASSSSAAAESDGSKADKGSKGEKGEKEGKEGGAHKQGGKGGKSGKK